MRRQTMSSEVAVGESSACRDGSPQASHAPVSPKHSHRNLSALTIEQAIQEYLEDRSRQHRRPKTLEWHQKALGLFQHYLQTEHKCVLLAQMTQAQVCGWLEWLPQIPTVAGHPRSSSTVESYARSVRAFCHWLVRHRYLPATPFAHLLLPRVEIRLFHGKLGEYSDKSDRILGI